MKAEATDTQNALLTDIKELKSKLERVDNQKEISVKKDEKRSEKAEVCQPIITLEDIPNVEGS